MGSFTNRLMLPFLIYSIYQKLARQKQFLARNIRPVLDAAVKQNDGSLDESDLLKITHYYGLAVPAILGEAFCTLQARQMSNQERMSSTCQGAMTGLFDDFFDKTFLAEATVKNKISGTVPAPSARSNEALFDHFYQLALQLVPEKEEMQEALLRVHDAQVASQRQSADIPIEEIRSVTFLKGGTSLLFYRTAFCPAAGEIEKNVLFELGGLMQLANDIFDVYKDREAGIRTMVTECRHMAELRIFFSGKLEAAYTLAFSLPYKDKHIKNFLELLSLGIFSRCFVCLDQLERNEQLTGNIFQLKEYNRSQLVCDMDLKKNMLRSAAYHLQFISRANG